MNTKEKVTQVLDALIQDAHENRLGDEVLFMRALQRLGVGAKGLHEALICMEYAQEEEPYDPKHEFSEDGE